MASGASPDVKREVFVAIWARGLARHYNVAERFLLPALISFPDARRRVLGQTHVPFQPPLAVMDVDHPAAHANNEQPDEEQVAHCAERHGNVLLAVQFEPLS